MVNSDWSWLRSDGQLDGETEFRIAQDFSSVLARARRFNTPSRTKSGGPSKRRTHHFNIDCYWFQMAYKLLAPLRKIARPAGMKTAVICPPSLKLSYAPHPLLTWRCAIATGKSGVVAQPRSVAPAMAAGGVQSFALGRLSQPPALPDSPEFVQVVPSVGVKEISTRGAGIVTAVEPPPPLPPLMVMPTEADVVGEQSPVDDVPIAESVPLDEPYLMTRVGFALSTVRLPLTTVNPDGRLYVTESKVDPPGFVIVNESPSAPVNVGPVCPTKNALVSPRHCKCVALGEAAA